MSYVFEVTEGATVTMTTPDYMEAKDRFESARRIWAEKDGNIKIRFMAVAGDRAFVLQSANVGKINDTMQFV